MSHTEARDHIDTCRACQRWLASQTAKRSGAKGGSVKSEAKTAAARRNIAKRWEGRADTEKRPHPLAR